ncbi:hypothetical protein Tco_0463221 [Tanacetum coccineum]
MEELYQPTMNGWGRPIAPINIQATDFELKNHMIQKVQNSCQFHGLSGDDANKHLDKFLTITQSMKQNGVTKDTLRLYLFPYSLTHHATAYYETCGGPHAYYECQAGGGYTQEDGVLLSNTVPNPQEHLKVITIRSGVTLAGPLVPPPPLSSSKEVDQDLETITDQVLIESTTRVPPLVVQPSPASTSSELPLAPVSSLVIPKRNPHQHPIPYSSRLNKEKLQDKVDIQIHSFLQMFKKIYFNISFAEALARMPKFAKMVKDLLTNKEKLLKLENTP